VIDILLTVFNGMPYLEEQIASLVAQSHTRWRLWVRDDGSEDGTAVTLAQLSAADERIHLVSDPAGSRLGALGGFSWLLEKAARDAEYVMFCDADDRWLPDKIAETWAVMQRTETARGPNQERVRTPTLVHTDLTVVDANMIPIAESLWAYQGLRPELASLNRMLIQNCVTGCTAMINRPLRELSLPVPGAAVMHDWWLALVASCFGRVAYHPKATVLYRQHGRNDTGAHRYPTEVSHRLRRAREVLFDRGTVHESLRRTADQAAALLERYGDRMTPGQRQLVARYASIPGCHPLARKLTLIGLGTLLHRFDRNVGLILRA
jgi:glycosyltransferase involved in cell wall biosynthesis